MIEMGTKVGGRKGSVYMHFEGILKVFRHNFGADLVELGMVGMVQSLVDGLQFVGEQPCKKNPDLRFRRFCRAKPLKF